MGIKDKERRNEYERRKWKERRDAKLLALGIKPEDRPVGGTNGNRGQSILPNERTLPAEIRLKRAEETDDEYNARYNRERVNHWNARNREYVAERARKNYLENKEQYRATAAKWDAENPEKVKAYQKKYFEANKEERLAKLAAWAKENPERVKATRDAWFKANRHVMNQHSAAYRAQLNNAAPSWTDWDAITEIYEECAKIVKETGIEYNVDHIIPIRGKDVCGLHVWYNLRVITETENCRKSNRWSQEEGIAPMNGE